MATLALEKPILVAAPELKLLQWGETLDCTYQRLKSKGKSQVFQGQKKNKGCQPFCSKERKDQGKLQSKEGQVSKEIT